MIWEYMTVKLTDEPGYEVGRVSEHLNELGRQGWEAFACAPTGTSHDQLYSYTSGYIVLLKRPRPDAPGERTS
ncbi:MAG: DUF4177 domain-containing protein [Catenulispora sp.]|nr:DUF4177 domain-containing protein [Catenulispora sp.]